MIRDVESLKVVMQYLIQATVKLLSAGYDAKVEILWSWATWAFSSMF